MNFIDALEQIILSKDLKLCESDDERSGKHNSICVYKKNGEFLGKIYFADGYGYFDPYVDKAIEELLIRENNNSGQSMDF